MLSHDDTRERAIRSLGGRTEIGLLKGRFERRRFLRTAAMLGMAIPGASALLAACGSSSSTPTTGATTSSTTGTSQVSTSPSAPSTGVDASPSAASVDSAKNQKLTVSMFLEPNSLDPAQSTYVPGTVVLKNVVETLLELDQENQAHPRLATKWEVTTDGLSWTWSLRYGIKFQDGTPFNADAVKFSFDRILDPATQSQTGLSEIGPYDSSEVIDPQTVKMTFKEVYAPLINNLSDVVLGIVSPAAVKKYGQDFAQHPVGTGPYVFQEWAKGDHITVTRWDQYVTTSELVAHKGPAYIETIVFRLILEDQTRLATLKNGESDFIFRIPSLDVADIKSDSAFQVFENMFTGDPTMFLINRQLPPTADLPVAQAVEFAINKDVLNKIGTNSISTVAWGPLKSSDWGYNPDVKSLYKYDPDQAKQLLDEGGWKPGSDGLRSKGGQSGKLVINVKDDAITVSMLEAIQGMLKAVGLDLQINTMALAASEDLAKQGKNSLTFMDWRGTDPDILTVHFHSKNIGGWNMGYFKNEQVDQLLDTARATVDRDKRLEMYTQVQMLIMQQAATLPLFDAVQVDAAKKELAGVRYDATKAYVEWYDVHFA